MCGSPQATAPLVLALLVTVVGFAYFKEGFVRPDSGRYIAFFSQFAILAALSLLTWLPFMSQRRVRWQSPALAVALSW